MFILRIILSCCLEQCAEEKETFIETITVKTSPLDTDYQSLNLTELSPRLITSSTYFNENYTVLTLELIDASIHLTIV